MTGGEIVPSRLDKAHRFLDSARLLLDAGDYDSSASRAYFAVFHGMVAMLEREAAYRERSPTRWKHETVRDRFVRDFVRGRNWFRGLPGAAGQEALRRALEYLVSAREDGDYQVGAVDRRRAREQVEFAEAFVGEARERIGYV